MSSLTVGANEKNKLIPKIVTHNQSDYNLCKNNTQNSRNKLSYSYTFNDIFQNDTNWSEDLKKYDYNKKNLQWGYNPKPPLIKEHYIKSNDLCFNPITQKYKDKEFDKELKRQEMKELKDKIALNYDNDLRVIQTYDIINLKDRFKGFENHPNYPKIKNNISSSKRNANYAKHNYNIISNINLNKHHYDKPENRPKNIDIKQDIGNHRHSINMKQSKDYNIISNRYDEFDKEKKELDLKIQKLEASKIFYKTRDYDLIKGVYVDEEKENKFQEEKKNEMNKLKSIKRNTVFNPFNSEIYDKEKYEEDERKKQKKIYRYSLKPGIELYQKQQNLRKEIEKDKLLKSKLIYQRFKYMDKRGYDFFTGKEKYNQYKKSVSCRNVQDPWEMIKNGVNNNETLSNKNLYICYDKDDCEQKFNEMKINRENMIKNLKKMENEEIFKIKKNPPKINLRLIRKNNFENKNNKRYIEPGKDANSFSKDKNAWFSQDKNNNYFHN